MQIWLGSDKMRNNSCTIALLLWIVCLLHEDFLLKRKVGADELKNTLP